MGQKIDSLKAYEHFFELWKNARDTVTPARVPRVYLGWANMRFLAFFAFNRMNNLRILIVAFGSIPTAPTNPIVFSQTAFSVFATER